MRKCKFLAWLVAICLLASMIPGTAFAATNGWDNSNGYYVYYRDGEMVCNEVIYIDGAYYGFDYSGKMYDDTTFDFWDEELGRWVYYRAKAGGELYVNEWYENDGGDWYYYGAEGKGADDFTQIGGTWYFFEEARMLKDTIVYSEKYQKNYYIGEDGTTSVEAPDNGWWYAGDDCYYFADGEAYEGGVYLIGGAYYGFDYSGKMYDDTTFDFWDEELDRWVYYRAKAGGELYVNEWYENDWGDWYYYGAEGKGADDFTQIGGKWYFFENAYMIKDQIVYSELYQKQYYIGVDGTTSSPVPDNGWWHVGEDYYYLANGEAYEGGVYPIGGAYYGFDYSGKMYDDTTFDFWDSELDRWVYYRAKAGGKLYVNEWYESDGGYWYYYGAEGAAPRDFTKLGNTWYYFSSNGRMASDEVVWSEKYQKNYYISEDGKSSIEAPVNGWWNAGDEYYYFSNGEAYEGGVYQIGGAYYYFGWDGRMYDDVSFSIGGEIGGVWAERYYRAKKGGKLYVNEWYENDGGDWYYYGAEGAAPRDFTKLGNTWYYFSSNGRMASDEIVWSEKYQKNYYISEDGKSSIVAPDNGWWYAGDDYYYFSNGVEYTSGVYLIGGKYYGFDWNGRMYDDTEFGLEYYDEDLGYWVYDYYRAKAGGKLYVNEWYENDWGDWYYYGAEGKGADDFTQIGGKWYFFENSYMVTDRLVYSDLYGKPYVISADGASSTAITEDGWVNVSGDYYYVLGGNVVSYEVLKIDNKWYAFDSEGKMITDTTFGMDDYDEETGEYLGYYYYRAKLGGTLYVNEWYEDEYGDWYYYGAGGKALNGRTKLNNSWYYFSYEGRMIANDWMDGYAYGADGKQITATGKQDIGDRYVYVKADGTIVDYDWVQIGGKWYFFNPVMMANTIFEDDGKLYTADNVGVCTPVTGTGIYANGIYDKVYLENGKIATGWKQVNGAWYYFDTEMYANGVYTIKGDKYVFDVNGKLFKGGWLMLGDDYVYADTAGKALIGLQTIGGKQYYFNSDGRMVTDTTVTVNGVQYVIDDAGKAEKLVSGNGWKKIGGDYYYLQNGKPLTGVQSIGGKLYYFYADGEMATDTLCWWDQKGGDILLGADGAAVTGWAMYDGSWVYADKDYMLVDGKQSIGGKNYIFGYEDYDGVGRLMTGTFWWDGKIVTTDSNGAIVSEKDPADGWSYAGGSVYYYKNGEAFDGWVGDYLISDGRMMINTYASWEGDYYAFDVYGKYVKSGWHRFNYGNGDYSDYVYAKPGGKLCRNEWYVIDGVWYYFDGVYLLSDGVYEVDGDLCRFDASGKYLGKVSAADGWEAVGSDWYYIHAGEPVTGVQWINGQRYVFDDFSGVLSKGGFVWYGYEGVAYTDSDGKVVNYTGWKLIGGEWCYFDANNLFVTGWFQDNGKVYYGEVYWDENDELHAGVVTGYLPYGGKLHYFGSDGVYVGEKGVENGWFNADGEWYYFRNGDLVYDYQVIDGKGYFFAGGMMVKDVEWAGRYFDKSGVHRTTKGWYKTSEGWIYVNGDGTLANGVQKIDGKEYYFRNYLMVR